MDGSTDPHAASRKGNRRGGRAAAFLRDSDGALLVFGVYILVLMLIVGGLSVDLMRYEAQRSRIQNTADRAALAAASMRQELEPEEVVADYFAKAGFSAYHTGTTVDVGLNYRNVQARTTTSVNTLFMRLMGIDTLASPGAGSAEERITNVEIAMVLDISGSMQQTPSRIVNLKAAADEFVAKILADDTDNRISISLVPYNGQVNIGPQLTQLFNITHRHGIADVNCVDMPPSVYDSLTLSRSLPMSQTADADTFTTVFSGSTPPDSWNFSNRAPNPGNKWCPPNPANFVRPLQNNAATLRAQIQALTAVGATSIDAGMRWGLTLLDPGSRSVVSDLVAMGAVPAHFAGRPLDFDDPEVLKVIVLMTDGEHFPEERVNDAYKSGMSPIWRSNGDGNYSIHHPTQSGSNKFWVPHRNSGAGEWRSAAWNSGGGVTQLSWVQVWQQLRVKWVAWQLYARPLGGANASSRTAIYNSWVSNFRSLTPTATMDARLNGLCTMAKDQGVVIFGIAFEAPPGGVTAIRNCASPNRFYDVQGLQIGTAFRQIRSQISSLRLTQ